MGNLRSTRSRHVNSFVLGALLLFASTSAWSTSVIELADEQKVALSSHIVSGKVADVRSEWNAEGTQIHTIVTIEQVEMIKGQLTTETLELRLLGGRVGDDVMEIVDSPSFSVGEEVILFLENPAALMPIVGLFQGKVDVATDSATGSKSVRGGVSRDAFVRNIRGMVQAQTPPLGGEQ